MIICASFYISVAIQLDIPCVNHAVEYTTMIQCPQYGMSGKDSPKIPLEIEACGAKAPLEHAEPRSTTLDLDLGQLKPHLAHIDSTL